MKRLALNRPGEQPGLFLYGVTRKGSRLVAKAYFYRLGYAVGEVLHGPGYTLSNPPGYKVGTVQLSPWESEINPPVDEGLECLKSEK